MVYYHVVAVLHVEAGKALVGYVAGAETYVTYDYVVAADVHRVARDGDAAAGSRLSED